MVKDIYLYNHYDQYDRVSRRMLEESLETYDLYSENLSVINQVAYFYYQRNDFYHALDFVLKAHALTITYNYPNEYYFTIKLTGDIYYKLGAFESASKYYMMALNQTGDIDTNRKKCDILCSLSATYLESGILDLATDYGVEALQMAELLEEDLLIGNANLELCRIHRKRRLGDKALKFGLKSVEMYKKTEDQRGLALIYLEIASIYANQKDMMLSMNFYEKALGISMDIGFEEGIIHSNYLLGSLMFKEGNTGKALIVLEEALEVSRRNSLGTHKVDLYYLLSEIYAETGEFELAYNAYKTGTELNEHIRSERHRERIYQLQNEFNMSLKDQQLKHYKEENQTLERRNKELTEEVIRDPLTHLLNRRGLRNAISGIEYLAKDTLILCDIDDFKQINDQYGHPCGDVLLQSISDLMVKYSGEKDLIARWGGEEFLILLPDTSMEAAVEYAQRMMNRIALEEFGCDDHSFRVTMTFGIASMIGDFETSIHLADQRLYEGKGNGKNQVVFK